MSMTPYRMAEIIAKASALGGLVLFLLLAGMTVVDVLMRWLFNSPVDVVAEFGGLITAVSVAATLPIALWGKRGIAVRVLGTFGGNRLQYGLDVLSHVATIVVLSGMVWQLGKYTIQQAQMNSTTWLMHWPTPPWWWTVTGIVAVAMLVELLVMIDTITRAEPEANDPAPKGDVSI